MKRIISMLLILTTLFSFFALTASAARAEEYLSDVALIYEDSVEDALEEIEGTDWKLFEQDLNPDADYMYDDGVYLIYKTSTNVEDAITDLRVMDMYGGYVTTNYQKELEASRTEYKQMVADLRLVANEFKSLYEEGDGMAKLAYRQMNYYKDVGETDMLMGEFFLNMPTDDNKVVQVMMEGNTMIFFNLISLLAVGVSGADGTTLSTRIDEMYAIRDTLTDLEFYDSAEALSPLFAEIKSKLVRYDSLAEEHDLEDEDMTEEEFVFLSEYATIADLLGQISYGDATLSEFIRGNWTIEDLYPIVAAFTPGQKVLVEMGQLETVLKYNSPSKPVEELNKALDELEKGMKDEDGNLKIYDVYLGVDRSIFKGDFAMTNAAERQQALTGETWDAGSAASRSLGVSLGYIVASVVDLAMAGTAVGAFVKYASLKSAYNLAVEALKYQTAETYLDLKFAHDAAFNAKVAFKAKWGALKFQLLGSAIALALIILGTYAISTAYNYYNPDYLEIPNTLIDVRETDLGDKYIKYTAAKVFGEEDMNADFNAYEGKEWIALYYTKDAHAGNCLLAKFVHNDSNATIARRHQGIAMFGETEAFNLNSHVYDGDAPGVYVTIRYSTAKKAAENMPPVVGSMVATGALYTLSVIGGAGVGVGATLLVLKAKKKKEETPSEVAQETTTETE